jgi:hypothetical protein
VRTRRDEGELVHMSQYDVLIEIFRPNFEEEYYNFADIEILAQDH